MAHFLNRLASRAVGVANLAQPILPGLFTPGFGLEGGEPPADFAAERIANQGESRSTPSERVRRATLPGPVEPLDSNTSARGSNNGPLHESFPAQEETAWRIHRERLPMSANAMDATRPAASRTLLNSRGEGQPAEVDPYDPRRFSTSSIEPSGNEVAGKQVSGSIRPRPAGPMVAQEVGHARRPTPGAFEFEHTVPANPKTISARRDRSSSAGPEAPVIRVTIGRIDVRAQFPATAHTPAPRHARAAAISLDEYLKQRSEGKR